MSKQTDWQQVLTPTEFAVCRQAATERPFTGVLLDEKRPGEYICKCCSTPLFSADTKFDSGCGWPSFYAQSDDGNVGYRDDSSHGMRRTEIFCKQCDAHLGHVFSDVPQPTGQRYCLNSVSLTFNSSDGDVVKG